MSSGHLSSDVMKAICLRDWQATQCASEYAYIFTIGVFSDEVMPADPEQLGRTVRLMIEEMDMANEHGDLMGDGMMFTTHPTDHIQWSELQMFINRLRQYYELLDRDIMVVNS